MAHSTGENRNQSDHVCPVWVGYLLASPLRRLKEHPERLLEPIVEPGMTVVDLGCAMGFFSLPLARMVGPAGRVVCLDIQKRMLLRLERRARRRGLSDRIETRLCTQETLGIGDLEGRVNLVNAFHVIHETAHPARVFEEVWPVLAPGGRVVVAEPAGHVSEAAFRATCDLAESVGLVPEGSVGLRRKLSALFAKPREPETTMREDEPSCGAV